MMRSDFNISKWPLLTLVPVSSLFIVDVILHRIGFFYLHVTLLLLLLLLLFSGSFWRRLSCWLFAAAILTLVVLSVVGCCLWIRVSLPISPGVV